MTAPTTDAVPAPAPTLAPARSPAAVPVAGAVLLLLVAFDPAAGSPWFTARAAVLLVAGLAGLPLLASLARGGDRSAVAGAAFAAWAVVSAVAAGTPLAWFGAYGHGTGALFVACLAGAWALGRHLDAGARRLAAGAFLAGAAANAAVAVLQGPFDLSGVSVFEFQGRSAGLLGNPVFLGAVCAGGAALLPARAARRPAAACGLAVLFGAAAQLGGARVGLALTVVAVAAGLRAAGPARTGALLAAVAVGVGAGVVLDAERAEETSALARISTEPTGGLTGRVESWRSGLAGAADRPVLGHGPGRYSAASGPHRTLAGARAFSRYGLFLDAHDLAVEYAATTGFVGLALLACWLGLSALGARPVVEPGLLVAAGVLFASQLLQPQNVAVTPLGFLLLGAAAAGARGSPALPRWAGRGAVALGLAATVPAVVLLAGDNALKAAILGRHEPSAERAQALLPPWALPVAVETRIHQLRYERNGRPEEVAAALASARRALRRDPDDPDRWIELGTVYGQLDRLPAAAGAFARALEEDPWSQTALRFRAQALEETGRDAPARACRRLLALLEDRAAGDEAAGADRRACLA